MYQVIDVQTSLEICEDKILKFMAARYPRTAWAWELRRLLEEQEDRLILDLLTRLKERGLVAERIGKWRITGRGLNRAYWGA